MSFIGWNPAPMITAMSNSKKSKNIRSSKYYSITEHQSLMKEQKNFYLDLLERKKYEINSYIISMILFSICIIIFIILGILFKSDLILILAYPLSIFTTLILLEITIGTIFD